MKHCNRCDTDLPRESFYHINSKNGPSRLSSYCKKCTTSYKREHMQGWRKDNPERSYLNAKRSALKRRYGITIEEFDQMLLDQNSRCKICDKTITEYKEAHIDHNHGTGKVRGVLCKNCNWGLGDFMDNPEYLRKAANYLEANA